MPSLAVADLLFLAEMAMPLPQGLTANPGPITSNDFFHERQAVQHAACCTPPFSRGPVVLEDIDTAHTGLSQLNICFFNQTCTTQHVVILCYI